MLTFQELIEALNGYWSRQGCLLIQPYDLEMGAGTFHPATFLRVLGPEPWKAAYVQPSRRPTDGRYGENPNRLQYFYQYQVILKPSPLDVQDLYLKSLDEFRHPTPGTRLAICGRRLGVPDPGGLGSGLGGLAGWDGNLAIHLLSTMRGYRPFPCIGGA